MIPRTDHDAIVFAVVDSFVSGLEQMPARVVPLLVGARGYQEMDQIVRDQIKVAADSAGGEALAAGGVCL